MSMEKLIVELYGRVATLEDLNRELVARIEKLESLDDLNKTSTEETERKITRTITRDYAIEQLEKNNPKFTIKKGSRKDGADLIGFEEHGDELAELSVTIGKATYPLKANFYHSKSYSENFVRGWHTVKKEDIDNEDIQFYIFLVEYSGEFYTWLFSRTRLKSICYEKDLDANELYHFYFTIKDGKNYEDRDKEIDTTEFFEQWDIPSKRMRV